MLRRREKSTRYNRALSRRMTEQGEVDRKKTYAVKKRTLFTHLRPGVELEYHAEDPVLLGGRLRHNPLRHLELHGHDRPPHALVVVAEGEQDLRHSKQYRPPPPSPRKSKTKQETPADVLRAG